MREQRTNRKVEKRLFSVQEAAVYLGRSDGAVRELAKRGALPYVKADRRVHFDRIDLDAFIEKNKVLETF